tara:strand:- start:5335 stop:6357 length:1023 start_codon:yes stop_codon:yes gene_type:complete
MTALHITNGDAAARIIKNSTIKGDILPWRDPMHHGPFPAGLSLDDASKLRAGYLAGPGMDLAQVEHEFTVRDAQLRTATDYDSVILWFEHDLLDQLQILQILDWFAQVSLGGTTLEIICIDRFPGHDRFRGIGELAPENMASLHDHRQPVTDAMLTLAQQGWRAFRSDVPDDVLTFAQGDLAALPFLRKALQRHFQEYPSATNGLTRTQAQLLSLVANGVCDPVDLFVQNMNFETALFIGDWPTFAHLETLCNMSLLACTPHPFVRPSRPGADQQRFRNQQFRLTDAATQVLNGRANAIDLIHRDAWLGGVHLRSDQPMWTWQADGARFVLRPPVGRGAL